MSDDLPPRHPHAPAPGSRLASHYAYCFGCGTDHPSGLHLRIEAGEGLTMTGTFVIGEEHQGAPGLGHGGLVAAAFDEVLGALNWLLLVPAVTGRLEVDFRKPVPVGSALSIAGRIEEVSGRKIWTSGVGTFSDGTVAAQARGLFIQVPIEHFTQHGRRSGPTPLIDEMRAKAEYNP